MTRLSLAGYTFQALETMVHTAFLALRRTAVDAKLHQRQSPKRIRACLALMQVRVEPRYLTKRERRSMTCCHN